MHTQGGPAVESSGGECYVPTGSNVKRGTKLQSWDRNAGPFGSTLLFLSSLPNYSHQQRSVWL